MYEDLPVSLTIIVEPSVTISKRLKKLSSAPIKCKSSNQKFKKIKSG